ncbi:NUDIX hydrolase [Martelella alba]|uniref:GDP-mannose pyrophosphatase n=1 Tax=Martelella alba TaxID=2590451 RepID=A0A506UAV3_9HYPH|nr:NUDIX hydrolase [Martelella alba]TPW29729.1 NUDIX hydrolase [Martelella alba]
MTDKTSDRVSILETKQIYSGWTTLNAYRFSYAKANGEAYEVTWEVCMRPEAAAVLVFDRDLGKFVFVRQFRMPAYLSMDGDGFMLEVAAGLIDDGEVPLKAAQREVLEETGFRVEALHHVLTTLTAPGLMTEHIHCYATIVDAGMRVAEGGGLDEENEDLEIVTIGFDEAIAMVVSGEIVDAKTVILLQWAAMNRSFFGL